MRQLRYTLELPDGTHHEHAAVDFDAAERLLRTLDWKSVRDSSLGPAPGGRADNPFLLFLDGGESFFMVSPDPLGVQVTVRIIDKWNLLGFMAKQKSFTLEFGILGMEDVLALLKLFFEDNYPALRTLEKNLGWDDQGEGRE